jgi:hypothetical protein
MDVNIIVLHGIIRSRDSPVGIAMVYGLDDQGSISGRGTASGQALGPTQPPIQWVPRALSPGTKRPGREAGHSP